MWKFCIKNGYYYIVFNINKNQTMKKNQKNAKDDVKCFENLSKDELDILKQYEEKVAIVNGKKPSSVTAETVKKKYSGAIFPHFTLNTMKMVIDNW